MLDLLLPRQEEEVVFFHLTRDLDMRVSNGRGGGVLCRRN